MTIKDKWIDFNGTDGYVNAGREVDAYKVPKAITLEAWISPDTYVVGRVMGIISKLQTNTSPNSGYALSVTEGRLIFEFYDTTGTRRKVETASSVLPASGTTWYHVAATYDGATMKLYVDGVLQPGSTSVVNASIEHNNEAELWIGRGPLGFFNGKICEARLWDVARTDTQLQTGKLESLDASATGLRARWPLDDGSTLYANDSRNGLKSQLLGSAVPGSNTTTSTVAAQPTMQAPTALINTSSVLTAALDKLNRKSVMGLLKQLSEKLKSLDTTVDAHDSAIDGHTTTIGQHATTISGHTTTIAQHANTINDHTTKIGDLRTDLNNHINNHDQVISTYVNNAVQNLLTQQEFSAVASNLEKMQRELEIVRTAAIALDNNELTQVTKVISDALNHSDLGKMVLNARFLVGTTEMSFGSLINKIARPLEVKETKFAYNAADTDIESATFTMSDNSLVKFTASRAVSGNLITYTFNTASLQNLAATFEVQLRKSTLADPNGMNLTLDEYEAVSHSNVYYDLKLN